MKYFLTIVLILISSSVFAQTDEAKEFYKMLDDITNYSSDTIIYNKLENDNSFPGGEKSWRRFLYSVLNPNVGKDNDIPDGTYTVVIRFVIRKDGYTENLVALTNLGYGLEKEAMRVLKMTPRWMPAKLNGKFVSSYREQPITFIYQTVERNN